MINLTANKRKVLITHKQRGVCPVVIEATIVEHNIFATSDGNEFVLTVFEEVTLRELHGLGVPEFHDAIGTVVDICLIYGQLPCLAGHNTISTTAIEVAVEYKDSASPLNTDDATVAIATLRMADGEILHDTALTVHETQTEGISGIDLNTGVVLATNGKATEILQRELLTIVGIFADDNRLVTTIAFDNSHPSTTRNTREEILSFENPGEVQMNISTNLYDAVVTKSMTVMIPSTDSAIFGAGAVFS